jgi:hypothetical protein
VFLRSRRVRRFVVLDLFSGRLGGLEIDVL